MQPYSLLPINLLLLLILSLVIAAPAPDITYNPTKEAPCLVKWEIQTDSDTIERYEVAGHCMFLDSVDKLCSGGFRAPGFCPIEDGKAVNCCIRRECGRSKAGLCINRDIPITTSVDTHYSLNPDPACPSFWGAPATCYMPISGSLPPPGRQLVRIGHDGSSPSPAQPEAQKPQPMPNTLSFNDNNDNNNNQNLWTVPTTGADVNNDDVGGGEGRGGRGRGGIGGILLQQQQQELQQDVGFSLFDQQQPVAALSMAANGGGAATNGGVAFLDDNQPRLSSSGANGDARDGIINPDGSAVDADGAATDSFIFR